MGITGRRESPEYQGADEAENGGAMRGIKSTSADSPS